MRTSSSALLAGLALALGVLTASPAWAGMTLTGTPKVVFNATGSPGFLDIEGVTNTVKVADDGTTLSFAVPMTTVSTGIELRDDHMNEHYVEVAKYPDVTMKIPKASVQWPANVGDSTSGKVSGTFNVHGVDLPTEVSYTIKKGKTSSKVTAKFAFDTAKAGITIPAYLGITVDPAMTAEATLELVDNP